MHSFPKYFNMMVQAWNTIFFGLVGLGGIYLITLQSYVIGIVLTWAGVKLVYKYEQSYLTAV